MTLREGVFSCTKAEQLFHSNSVGPLVALWLQYKTGKANAADDAGTDEFLVLMYGVA